MNPWIAGGAMGVGAAADFFSNKSAQDAQNKRLAEISRWFNSLFNELPQYTTPALQERQKALEEIGAGYDKSIESMRGFGRAAEDDARDEAEAAFGDAEQMMISSGMYNPQHYSANRSAVGYRLSRALGEIRERTAAMVSPMFAARGEATARARGDIAGQYMQNFGLKQGVRDRQAALSLDTMPYATSMSPQIGALAGAIDKIFGGGGGGGASSGPSFQNMPAPSSWGAYSSDDEISNPWSTISL